MRGDGANVTLAGSLHLELDDDGLCTTLRGYGQVAEGLVHPAPGWGT